MPKPLNIEMDPTLARGDGRCEMADGSEVKIRVPQQTPPKGTVKVRMSREDWTQFLSETKPAPKGH